MTVSKAQYDELKKKQEDGTATDDDNRLVRQYEQGDYDKDVKTPEPVKAVEPKKAVDKK